MFHHLKLPFSKYDPYHLMYKGDESWKPQALSLQRDVLKSTLEWWPESSTIIGDLGKLHEMSVEKYLDYVNTLFWNSLFHVVQRNTNAPFRHGSILAAIKFLKHDQSSPDLEAWTTWEGMALRWHQR
jgi:hypothetical protein